ncbi:pyocin activator PrtN family protein [Pseudomonas sp. HY2-MNA-CIBAN-0224]|uniref:pyocin activator PrtN family protein n=1 Tax=Pseudomonas sp. HY2-MNA-CIBAN-0224 TaxID=3140471 RepID=UPI003332B665
MLWQQYNAVSIPLDTARRNYFPHLSMNYFLRSVRAGRIPLRVVTGDWGGQRSKVVYLHDLASYLDKMGGISEP